MRFPGALLIAAIALAQPSAEPEIRGTVQEYNSNSPIAAAEITIKEFVLVDSFVTPKVIATILTNSRGEFSFKPGHIGSFYIEAKKDGYEDQAMLPGGPALAERSIQLSSEKPQTTVDDLALWRPGEITGRVLDVAGEPISDLRMTIEGSGHMTVAFRTDAKGNFQLTVRPGQYVLQTASRTIAVDLVYREGPDYTSGLAVNYSEQESKTVEEDYESLYWPGGAPSPSAALPLQVNPGATANLGTIVLRKIRKYRVHAAIDGECADDESRGFTVVPAAAATALPSFATLGCSKDLLLRGLQPGNYLLAIWSKQHWGESPFTITDHNIETTVRMSPAIQIDGRLIAPEGVQLSSLGAIRISTGASRVALGSTTQTPQPDAKGIFVLRDILWGKQSITLEPANSGTYVKEIRYGGTMLRGPVFEAALGAALEVVLDTNAATIEGVVLDSGKPQRATILMVRWPTTAPVFAVANSPPFQYYRGTLENGKFTIPSLAPGEYRLIALPDATNLPDGALDRILAGAERITLNRGEQKKLEVKLTDSAR